MKKPVFSQRFRDACFVIAESFYARKGLWAYETFDFINRAYFADRLPWPLIMWGLTAHGGCVAWSSTARDRSRPPLITLHPSLLGGTERLDPWDISPDHLGPAFAFDTILHECIHIHIEYNLGGHNGASSHNCPRWLRQVNRIAPLLGFKGVRAGISKSMRVPDPSAPRTKRGKVATRVVRGTVGNVPFEVAAGFPHAMRRHYGSADSYYTKGTLPQGAPRF
jgi:hypothetical protein